MGTVASKPARRLVSAGYRLLHGLGLPRLLAKRFGGNGIIFMAHRVQPAGNVGDGFAPNACLSITPDFLRRAITFVREQGMDVIALDEAVQRIINRDKRRFAVFTFDDGYRDNLVHAVPVLNACRAPFTIYVPARWPDGEGVLWWLALEQIIRAHDTIQPGLDALPSTLNSRTAREKTKVFWQMDGVLDRMPDHERLQYMRKLAGKHHIDLHALCRDLIMTWDELAGLARSDLSSIGAHSCTHSVLADLDDNELITELADARAIIERKLAVPCRHMAYPYGDTRSAGRREFEAAAKAGYVSAVTTTSRPVRGEDGDNLMMLPRIALDGERQNTASLAVGCAGVPDALRGLIRKIPG